MKRIKLPKPLPKRTYMKVLKDTENRNDLDNALTKTFKRHVAAIYDLADLSADQLVALHAKLSKVKKPTAMIVVHLQKK